MSRDVRVCFFGDSYTLGAGDETALGWVGRVVVAARASGVDLAAFNLGIGGDTSLDVGRRWYEEAARRLKGGDALAVVFAFGTNDADAAVGRPRVAPERALRALADCLDDAYAAGWPALVVGPPPVRAEVETAHARKLTSGMAAVCRERDVPFVDTLAALADDEVWHREIGAGDGYHPGASGYERLTALITPPLLDWLADLPPRG